MELLGFIELPKPGSHLDDYNMSEISRALDRSKGCVVAYNLPEDFMDAPFETSFKAMERLNLKVSRPSGRTSFGDGGLLRYLDVSTAMNRALGVLSNCRVDPSEVLAMGPRATSLPMKYTYPINPFYADIERLVSDMSECYSVSGSPEYRGYDVAAVIYGVGDGHDPYFQSHVIECLDAAITGFKYVAVTSCPNVVYHGRRGAVLSMCGNRINEVYLDFEGCTMDDVMDMAFQSFDNPVESKRSDFLDSWDFTGVGDYIPDVPIAPEEKLIEIAGFGTVPVNVSDGKGEDVYNLRPKTVNEDAF